ncbi:MAG TPA: phosphopantetheine-binding protein [Planctomycetaceae bacterium]|nr:phosphopantetheine-binding protein [Planctomycetaceae bacterium]
MVTSSRTPEGEPNRCPVCRSDICIEPSRPFGDAPCPSCGYLLWFVSLGGEVRYFPEEHAESVRERLIEVVSRQLGVPAAELRDPSVLSAVLRDLQADSLDLVELAMEFEDSLDD